MANSWFNFQQFRINQANCAMKISTDAVLLGALASSDHSAEILDVGTGTGVIALMLAQRYSNARVHAVEIDQEAAKQASENFRGSKFSDRISISNVRFQDFEPDHQFDLIVSNPPYFPNHLKSQDAKRNRAMHADELSFSDLAEKGSTLLSPSGYFWLILPPRQMLEFDVEALKCGLYPTSNYSLQDKPDSRILRNICAFSKTPKECTSAKIYVKNEDGTPHASYSKLVSGFLLAFKD